MVHHSFFCTAAVAISLVSTLGAPAPGNKGTAQHHSLDHGAGASHQPAVHDINVKASAIAPIAPSVNEDSDLDKVNNQWRGDKQRATYNVANAKTLLQDLASGKLKATPYRYIRDLEQRQRRLKDTHARMKGWHPYFSSEDGRKKADWEGKRAYSAQSRAVISGKYHDLMSDVMAPLHEEDKKSAELFLKHKKTYVPGEEQKAKWARVAETIPGRIEEIEREHKKATDEKEANYRYKYGFFLSLLEHGANPSDFPFQSTLQAKKDREEEVAKMKEARLGSTSREEKHHAK